MFRLSLVVVFASQCVVAEAQLFSRWRGQPQVSNSSCPGGVCPLPQYASPVATVAPIAARSPGHWSYPGTIDSHLESEHGVSTAGMTRQQKLDLHDSLHEGTAPQVRRASAVVVRGTYQSVGGVVSYGSTGSKVNYGSTGSRALNYGSVGSSLRVGYPDGNGNIVTSIGPSQPVKKQPEPQDQTGTDMRSSIRLSVAARTERHVTFGL